MKNATIAILGAGSWGTAVAIHLASIGKHVTLWGHSPQHNDDMIKSRHNKKYLPDAAFPETLHINPDLNDSLKHAEQVVVAVPSHAFASLLPKIPRPAHGIAWLTKGIDPASHKLLSELVAEQWGEHFPIAVISGPSFAREVAKNMPTALVLAGNDSGYLHAIRSILHHGNVRAYVSEDYIGVQLCGAVKNILAIACGVSDGLNYGANAKAALITRGLAEMSRLGACLGARPETFLGLAGVGDLVLTCTDDQSRNRRFGLQLGQGIAIPLAEKHIGQVVEGRYNAAQVCLLANKHQIEMPICQEVNDLLLGKITPAQAVVNLMQRPPKDE